MKTKIVLGIVVIVVSIIGGIVLQINENNTFSDWANKCLQAGGLTTITSVGFASEHYECVKDGVIINHIN